MTERAARRALVSVSDKTRLGELVRELLELGFEIVSTGGTRRTLEQLGLPVIDISAYTGFPEIMDGRVKTLHPKVHGAILGRPDLLEDAEAIKAHGIIPFELVVCNLYPFVETISKPDVAIEEAIEQIDIGGPSMIRSAAKNHAYVGVVTHPSQYQSVLEALKQGPLPPKLRRELAGAAFEMTAQYDRAIADYLAAVNREEAGQAETEQLEKAALFPPNLTRTFRFRQQLRYGENPHQAAAVYVEPNPPQTSLAAAEQLHGKELSYNNYLDLDAALQLVQEFVRPAATVIKHTNPCGCALGETLEAAFLRAYAGDPVSAFGSILGFNQEVDAATARKLVEPDRFIEAIIAPGYSEEAFRLLTTVPKWKKNVRLMRCPSMMTPRTQAALDYRRITGGLLVQERDELPEQREKWTVPTERQPTPAEREMLEFAWAVCKHVKSNAIVFAQDNAIVGVGAGQMSRVDSSFIAAYKAGERAKGGVVASDALYPFRDGVDVAAKAGIAAVIQPGGSVNDQQVIDACNEHGMAMIFTNQTRHFRH